MGERQRQTIKLSCYCNFVVRDRRLKYHTVQKLIQLQYRGIYNYGSKLLLQRYCRRTHLLLCTARCTIIKKRAKFDSWVFYCHSSTHHMCLDHIFCHEDVVGYCHTHDQRIVDVDTRRILIVWVSLAKVQHCHLYHKEKKKSIGFMMRSYLDKVVINSWTPAF